MIVVGLTGGIGSGKTTVANMFKELGVPIYIADIEAKSLMNKSKVLRKKLIKLFGNEAYTDKGLNRTFIASKIFNNKDLLNQMNAIVHHKVGLHFNQWLRKQKAAYVIKEAAIIFENNMEAHYHFVIVVTANEQERIKRVLSRENMTKDKIKAIIKNQLQDKEKIKRSDFVIVNEDLEKTKAEVIHIHQSILHKISQP